jgi:hypothetical protein
MVLKRIPFLRMIYQFAALSCRLQFAALPPCRLAALVNR